MTRKQFIALAEQLRRVRTEFINESDWLAHCRAIAAICQRSNSAFDVERFLVACKEWPDRN